MLKQHICTLLEGEIKILQAISGRKHGKKVKNEQKSWFFIQFFKKYSVQIPATGPEVVSLMLTKSWHHICSISYTFMGYISNVTMATTWKSQNSRSAPQKTSENSKKITAKNRVFLSPCLNYDVIMVIKPCDNQILYDTTLFLILIPLK